MASAKPSNTGSSSLKSLLVSPPYLELPEEDSQRGRKRRRSSATSQSVQLPSNGIRGRGRRRSLSQSQEDPLTRNKEQRSTTPDRTTTEGTVRKSPGRKYQKKSRGLAREKKKKRSQSPSRSRSFGHQGDPKPRRRQRTHSRSRVHGKENAKRDERENNGASKKVGFELTEYEDVAVED